MIFVTTGTQFSFDRLLSLLNKWSLQNREVKIVAQTGYSPLTFEFIETYPYLSPKDYKGYVKRAKVIVGHAGTGTIITAKENGIPAILMARQFELNEHRSEHQVSTVEPFNNIKGVYIVNDEQGLFQLLDNIDDLELPTNTVSNREQLIEFLKKQIFI